MPHTFTAIDFETATGDRYSICAVGIVVVEDGKIVDEYYSLIQPPENKYWSKNIEVHGIKPSDTRKEPLFPVIFPEIKKRLSGRTVVAHNQSFDKGVLNKTMEYYGIKSDEINLDQEWECTLKIYRSKGFKPANLAACCEKMDIKLNHHQALSDAQGCAHLYMKRFSL